MDIMVNLMAEPETKEQYEGRWTYNYHIEGYGIEQVTTHFPCPFCGAAEWYVVRLIDFGNTTGAILCKECGRSARHIVKRSPGHTTMALVQVTGPDPSPWIPIMREDELENADDAIVAEVEIKGPEKEQDDN